jgi:hypothetical protein
MLAHLWERTMMDVKKIPLGRAARNFVRRFEKSGEAEGKREALFAFLAGRRLAITEGDRARIEECSSLAKLDCWIRSAATATSVQAVLATAPAKPSRRAASTAPTLASGRGR